MVLVEALLGYIQGSLTSRWVKSSRPIVNGNLVGRKNVRVTIACIQYREFRDKHGAGLGYLSWGTRQVVNQVEIKM